MNHILLVEDDVSTVKLIKQYISEMDGDIKTISFAKAAQALQYAKKEVVDLFILDIQLLDYKGTSLAMQIRSMPEYKYTPIIFATALAGEELAAYREIKCYSFLIKPFSKTEFNKSFRDALGLSKQITATPKTIRIEQKQFIFEYEVKNIVYIEAFGKRIVIHTRDNNAGGDTISGYSLAKMLELIDNPAVVQCHKSFLVNSGYISKIDKQQSILYLKYSTAQIPIGNKYQSALWG
jgi:two-component system LytT family response regulator